MSELTGTTACVAYGLGCPRARVDTAQMVDYFKANGWQVTGDLEAADVVLVTTCAFCGVFEESSIRLLESADRRRRPGSRLVVVGCLAGIDPERVNETFDAVLIPPKDVGRLDYLIGATVPFASVPDPAEIEPYIETASGCFTSDERRGPESPTRRSLRRVLSAGGLGARLAGDEDGDGPGATSEHVRSLRVSSGCLGECTYCAIRFAAGPLKSKSLDDVMREFDDGLAAGYREFTLIAGDLGCYGQDIGTNIVDLLEAVMRRPDDFRLTLHDLDLKWVIQYRDRLISVLRDNQERIRFVLIPLQSGSDRILAAMRRGHGAGEAVAALRALRAACPNVIIQTHVLIGFPGETRRDFQDTLDLVRAVRFDSVVAYDYEDRPRTQASCMPNKVSRRAIKWRGLRVRLQTVGVRTALHYYVQDWGLRRTAGRDCASRPCAADE